MKEEIIKCYRVLDLEPGASLRGTKQAYRELVKVWHPDRFENDLQLQRKAQEKLKDINAAYRIISDHLEAAGDVPRSEADESQKKRGADEVKQNQDSHNLLLQIRDDRVEVTHGGFCYNKQFINAKEITAIRFGIGVFDLYCHIDFYTLGICGQGGLEINVDFKKLLRSKDQARKDQSAVIDALSYHVIPGLCTRIAKQIIAGHEQQMGSCWLTSKGIRGTVGTLLWKGEIIIPWSEVRFGTGNGQLAIRSTQNRNFAKSYELRTVWNAVIFDQIFKTLVELRS
jgi:hypothetical protein